LTVIDVRVLDERVAGHLPAYATAGSAGLDLRARARGKGERCKGCCCE